MSESDQDAVLLVRQAEVAFYGDQLTGALASDGDIYIPLSQLCASLDLQLSAQLRRIRRTEALSDGLHLLTLESQDGSRRPLVCLRVDLVPGWLGGVMTSRVKNEVVRAKLIAYQRDLYKVAWAVFGPMQASVMPAPQVEAMVHRMVEITNRIEAIDETLLTLTAMLRELAATAEQMKAVSVVVEGLKTEMNNLRAELADLETRSRTAFKVAGDRIKRLELRLHPGMAISEEQAARIKEAVTYVANALQERGKPRAYAEVWAALKQAFSLTEYKNLPQGRFSEALEWLNRWGIAVHASPRPVPPP